MESHLNRSLASLSGALVGLLLASCTTGNGMSPSDDAGAIDPFVDGSFTCLTADARACVGTVHYSCSPDGEFYSTVRVDCATQMIDGRPAVCVRDLGCVVCHPNEIFCAGGNAVQCNAMGDGYDVIDECHPDQGTVCRQGACQNLCDLAVADHSYLGCEFYAVDLDNASLGAGRDASAQQYAVVVSNPSGEPAEVIVERNNAAPGDPADVEEVDRVTVLPGDLEVFTLPRREVDGSSSFFPCTASSDCNVGESCWCSGGVTAEDGGDSDCRCRNAAGASGMNDGTHSALTSNAYHLRSVLPINAYQFNPLDNVSVFSNDASLLLPVSAISSSYTVVGWPQTIADSMDPNEDFDPTRHDEGLRAFLTIVGTAAGTHVTVTLGPEVRNVIGVNGATNGMAGDVWEFDIGPFDVLNLETGGFNADFTGTVVESSSPVSVFTGSEASDAPRFDTLLDRQCCADHLEAQLFPDDTLGTHFLIGRMYPRSRALNAAFVDPTVDSVGDFNEPEYIRVVAVVDGTNISTTLQPPWDQFTLDQGQSTILVADQDFEMHSDRAIAVLQVLAGQEAVGIPSYYPGGDPAAIAVAPVEQYRQEYVFLTPNKYAFDFVTITGPRDAQILLDEMTLDHWMCETAPADGIPRRDGDPPPDTVVHRCQLSFPDVLGRNMPVEDGIQNDGYHTLRSNKEIGLVVYGFDAFVSYAYAGGLNLQVIH